MSVNGFTFGTDPTIQKYNYESLDNIPDIENGTYPNMAVGSLLGTNKVTDKEPYFLRPSASIGDREFDTLVGGTLGWNQLVKELNSANWIAESNVTASYTDGVATISSSTAGNGILSNANTNIYKDNIYLVGITAKCSASISLRFGVGSVVLSSNVFPTDTYVRTEKIIKCSNDASNKIALYGNSATYTDLVAKDPVLIDLTTLFGSTIADYIYSLEQAHAGDGVAWVRKYLTNDYYAYCAPTLKHVSGVSAHVLTGFNQWDEEVESGYIAPETGVEVADPSKIRMKNYMRVLPNTTYYKKTPAAFWNVYYDENKQYIGYGDPSPNRTFTTPSNCHYIRSGFEAAYGTTYNNDICINLSGSRNGQYEPYESHTYPLDSTWVGMGIPKLDSANKLYFDGDTYASDGTVTERYGIRAYQSGDESLADAITDGTNTVYKLTTPTTSSASPFTSPQICDPDGTEEYVSTGLVPVGHETEYVENLADKLTDIPDLPTTAGTYRLKVTVSGGVPSYSWVTS